MGSRINTLHQILLSNTQKAYIAGFLDGDGCIVSNFEKNQTTKLGYRVRIRISFTQISIRRQVLDKFHSWLQSGAIAEYEHNNMAEYVIRNQIDVKVILLEIMPYLVVKQQHAVVALRILKLKEHEYSRESLEEMRKLTLYLRSLNHYPKRIDLDPVTTEA